MKLIKKELKKNPKMQMSHLLDKVIIFLEKVNQCQKSNQSLSRYMLRRSFPPLSFSPRKATTKPNMFPSLEHHYYSLLFFFALISMSL
jgi:hypothetical protein